MGKFIRHVACTACGSSDGGALYDNGTVHCFVCEEDFKVNEEALEDTEITTDTGKPKFLFGDHQDLPSRGLREKICSQYGYMVNSEEACHIASYRNLKGSLVAQKLRFAGKKFKVLGTGKNMPLFGMHLWGSGGGKYVTITEGEIDCLSLAQAFDGKWPVVSLPNGANSAVQSIQNHYEWLDSFENIVLCFDMDEPGQKAVEEAAQVLPLGKVLVMSLPDKDANEVLKSQGPAALVKAFWGAKPWRPDGIVAGIDITKESLKSATAIGYSLPYPVADEMLGGLRERELTLLTAGTGIGKSTLAREIAYHLHQVHGLTIGNVFLEESKEKTAQAYIAIDNNVPLGKLRKDPDIIPDEAWDASIQKVIHERMYFYDHFGSLDSDRLLAKIRYMRMVLGCHFVILDHISIVVSGQDSSSEGERRDIDKLMTKLRSLIEETGVGIIGIVHLKQPEGKAHEEGGRVTLSQLRGSGALKQLSDTVLALERNQQGEDANISVIRILKDREMGEVGVADTLEYNKETGRLLKAGGAFGTLDV